MITIAFSLPGGRPSVTTLVSAVPRVDEFVQVGIDTFMVTAVRYVLADRYQEASVHVTLG